MPTLEKGLVILHNRLARDFYEIELVAPLIASSCKPGQFVHVKVGGTMDPLLRRPLSIYDVDKKLGSITLLYKVVGRGTELLTRVGVKENIDIMGPLGRGFSLADNQHVLLVGGGVGIAPLVYLARAAKEKGCQVTVLYGAEKRGELVAFERLRKLEVDLMVATRDGSAGHKGLVADLLHPKFLPPKIDFIYTCGPEPMMALVKKYAEENGIPGEVSLEEHMACGVGACLGCARKLKPDDEYYVKVCKDGPVFRMDEMVL
ncbi:dihydroorotate oxidase B, electron transfer subunit [Thermosyntropha lipolytica DSM 11003]|uniref:Dihydroorotate dehydrogenase B (NAD(+)), electron transfer subunit n=1 Tax=Thermosyntropha lipolytica DSM 11003 TaxID=1123382 RepID=A0A1M5PY93_9FIRM|nr:dihydroorotate dehydrogenase electron transfer subunit [Thermosyntropha lipolytica]SHH06491.1 dihydroorotate oxidase B, electron transfer subunit [Thermosyntropha lipolytica DSM 11003]